MGEPLLFRISETLYGILNFPGEDVARHPLNELSPPQSQCPGYAPGVFAVPHCKSTGKCYTFDTKKKISYHKFPVDAKRKRKWLLNIRRDENRYFQVC